MFDKRKDHARPTQTPPAPGGRPASESPPTATQQSPPGGPAVIGSGLLVNGELSGEEDVTVSGRFQGKISLPKNSLLVSKGGHVEADVSASAVQIEGRVAGDIRCADKVVITATGQMEGTIVAPRVILVDGGKFKGSIDMDPVEEKVEEKAPQKPKASKSQAPPQPAATLATASAKAKEAPVKRAAANLRESAARP
jgi:cytoskeletal protein CcmA (bactofilin family)